MGYPRVFSISKHDTSRGVDARYSDRLGFFKICNAIAMPIFALSVLHFEMNHHRYEQKLSFVRL